CEEAGIRILRKGAREGPRIARVDRQRAPDRPTEIDQVDEQVVEREQQEPDAREQRELGRGAAEGLRQRHRATPKLENPSEAVSCRSVHDSLPTRRIIQNRASATIHNQRGVYPLAPSSAKCRIAPCGSNSFGGSASCGRILSCRPSGGSAFSGSSSTGSANSKQELA